MLSRLIFVLLLVVLVLTPIPYGTVEPWWKAAFICGVFVILILAIQEGSIHLAPWPLLLPLLALSGLALFQSWTKLSADPFQTRFFALQLLALTAFLALLCRYAASEDRVRVLVYTVVCVALVSAVFGLLRQTAQHQTGFLLPLLRENQGYGQFINKNHFAYLMEMALGLMVGLVLAGGSRYRLLGFALLLPLWVGLVLSNSRGGIMALLVQVVLAALFLFRAKPLRLALAGALVAGVLMGTIWIGGERLVTSFSAASTDLAANGGDGASRIDIWRASLKMFSGHPLLGVGLGSYWIGIAAYHEASGVLKPQEAHNDYLELLSSGGVVGLAMGIWFAVIAIRCARRNLEVDRGFIRAVRIGSILGIAGVATHSLLDFGLHLTGNTVVFLTLVMMASAKIESQKIVAVHALEQ